MTFKKQKVYEVISDRERELLEDYSRDYMDFLSTAKTERMAVDIIVEEAEKAGFRDLSMAMEEGIKPGDKVYRVNKNKMVVLFVVGQDLTLGMDIVGSHIDVPRLDLKPLPLAEDDKVNMAYLKTHYYGGVKKYHWTNLPLALHGVVFTKEGEKVDIHIGEKEDDPVFYINDLLIHLSRKQLEKKADTVIEGEQLQVVIGTDSSGQDDKVKEPIKANILAYLKKEYGIEEDDFQCAEIEVVPAGPAREVGFDRSLIAGHGHDDRICSFANLRGLLDRKEGVPDRTKVALFVDKEEIGSVGSTGMTSNFFEYAVADILSTMKEAYSELDLKRAMGRSRVLSADVTAAYDPQFPEVFDYSNSSLLGCGITVSKYTGSGGKGGSNDANAEYLAEIRKIFDREGVIWQTGELGKVDAGGGGTIAYILAKYNMDVVDCGTGMLSMHAPIELASKADAYETYRAYRAFFNA
ncbi:aminopeptidase [Kallipyga gabonensis]|uniref:aminopeptidase n=1 Tax=Kallipyga gabonensis TaxID=1686287 RepID=UPI0006B4555E|nr:aminopeptidase [Kallipyga gabonensis]